MPNSRFLASAADLVSTHAQSRAAFVALLTDRGALAVPLMEQAKALRVAVAGCERPAELLERHELRSALLTAAGLHEAELAGLSDPARDVALHTLVEDTLAGAKEQFVDELVYRFLLTKGETWKRATDRLLRQTALRRFGRSIAAGLLVRSIPTLLLAEAGGTWEAWDAATRDIPLAVAGIAWSNGAGPRTLLFDAQLTTGQPLDVVVLPTLAIAGQRAATAIEPQHFLGYGGIDGEVQYPGKRGRWTAHRRTLEQAASRLPAPPTAPYIFYVGAAIQDSAAAEIWLLLEAGTLTRAANARDETQLGRLCQWLILA